MVNKVLGIRLKDREWIAGPGAAVYTIIDVNALLWSVKTPTLHSKRALTKTHRITRHQFSSIEGINEFRARLKAWSEKINARASVQAVWAVPKTQ